MDTVKLDGKRYICKACHAFSHAELITYRNDDGKPVCPDCNLEMVELCALDHKCTCINSIHSGIAYCKQCGEAICPGCGSHDVSQVSRVTGYLSDVGGWGAGKLQELKDRHRVDIVFGVPT